MKTFVNSLTEITKGNVLKFCRTCDNRLQVKSWSNFTSFKICCIYSTITKLVKAITYLKKIKKKHKSVAHPMRFFEISIFSRENRDFCYIGKYR